MRTIGDGDRLVLEHLLGRPLTPFETVRHLNGNRHDNRPENLAVDPPEPSLS